MRNWILNNWSEYLLLLFFFSLYALFPSVNSTIDAYGYASYIRDGENLFLPHHLLYNALGYLWVNLFGFMIGTASLPLLKLMNAAAATLSVWVLLLILKLLGLDRSKRIAWALFVGGSWGVMRFATENETYILPIVFSLVSSYFFIKHSNTRAMLPLVLSGVFGATACLFHQIHFFWWFSLLIPIAFTRKLKYLAAYVLPALMVPAAYIIILVFYNHTDLSLGNLFQFVFRDFHSGAAVVSFNLKGVALSLVSIIRTFIQVHGYFFSIPRLFPWLLVGAFIAVAAWLYALPFVLRIAIGKPRSDGWFNVACIVALALHLLFAIVSHGNAEFMVMVPFLLALTASTLLRNYTFSLTLFSLGVLIWNTSLGLLPLHLHSIDGNRMVSEAVVNQTKRGGESLFIVFSKPHVDNTVKYLSGEFPSNTISATQRVNAVELKRIIMEALNDSVTVYTDCLLRPKSFSRESLTVTLNTNLFEGLETTKIDSVCTLNGMYYLVLQNCRKSRQ